MPCLSCGDSDEERSGCLSRCLARRRRRQPPPPSSTGQPQRNRQTNSAIELTGTAASNVQTSQVASQTGYVTRPSSTRQAQESLENRGVARVVSPVALHIHLGQRASRPSARRQQYTLPSAAARGAERHEARPSDGTEHGFPPELVVHSEASLNVARGRLRGQQRIYSWPRRAEDVRDASLSGPTPQQTDYSGVGGQTSAYAGMEQQSRAGSRAGTPQRAGQARRGGGGLTSPLEQVPHADLRDTVVADTGLSTDQPEPILVLGEDMCTFRILIDAHFHIAPKSDKHDRPTVESFLRTLTECHNSEVGWPHPAMVILDRPGIPHGNAETWGVHMESLYPPSISAPREFSIEQTKSSKTIDNTC
jgi:hypothetical protein